MKTRYFKSMRFVALVGLAVFAAAPRAVPQQLPFTEAILVKKGIVVNGGTIDSFDSQDPNYSSNGLYVVNKRKDGGDIGTIESNVVAAVAISNSADVYGRVATGPNSTVTTSSNSAIGSLAWIDSSSFGIQPGWGRSDMNVVIPDAVLPNMTGAYMSSTFASFLPGVVNGTSYTYVVSPVGGSGTYKFTQSVTLAGSQTMCINGNVTFYFSSTTNNSFVVSGSAFMYITPGSTLKMYFGGNANLSGGGVVNGSGFATNCACFGLPGCTNFSYSGAAPLVGIVYVPEADVTLSGAGGYVGSLVANSLLIAGNYAFHYDESLFRLPPNPVLSIAPMSCLAFSNLTLGGVYQLQQSVAWYWSNQPASFTATNTFDTQMVAGVAGSGDYRLTLSPVPAQAFATAEVVNGLVVGATVTSGGSGYVTNPAVTIVGGGGANATAFANTSSGAVTDITITDAGADYTNTPTVEIAQPPAAAVSPTLLPVMRLDCANLAPYDNYQIQFKSDLGRTWGNWNGELFSPSDVTNSQYAFITNGVGFFRLQYVP